MALPLRAPGARARVFFSTRPLPCSPPTPSLTLASPPSSPSPHHHSSFDAPLCSTCATLAEFVPPTVEGGAALAADCRACCTDAGSATAATPAAPRAAKAVLEVCDAQLRRHAHIQGFLDREAKKFGPGRVAHAPRWGMPPRLLLLDGGGALLEAVRIDGWKTEHIVEFLSARLVGGEGVTANA